MARYSPYASIARMPLRRPTRWAEQRRQPRFLCGPGQMVGLVVRDHLHVVPVYNISSGGAMIRLPRKLTLGERVRVAVGQGVLLDATIRWLDGERAGLGFTEA